MGTNTNEAFKEKIAFYCIRSEANLRQYLTPWQTRGRLLGEEAPRAGQCGASLMKFLRTLNDVTAQIKTKQACKPVVVGDYAIVLIANIKPA